jgi:transcriptional regulator with XRE-family HTH domain
MRTRAASPQHAFGTRVRELRLARGMTQEDLSDRCGLFRTYMSRIETGRANPTLTMIHALAASLAVPIAALFDGSAPVDTPVPRPARPSRGRVR